MKVEIEILNYKQIQQLKQEFVSGNLYFVQGGNQKGKTSFLQALLSLMEASSSNKQKLTWGEKEGHVKGTFEFNGADNRTYTVCLDYDDKKEKFTLIYPDATISSKKGDISEVFQYNFFTVDEWFAWGKTAEGQRKQAKIIKQLLPGDAQQRIEQIEALTGNKDRESLFKKRTAINSVLKEYEASLNQLGNADPELEKKVKAWTEEKEKLDKEIEEAMQKNQQIIQRNADIDRLLERKASIQEEVKGVKQRFEDFVDERTKMIAEYKEKIQRFENEIDAKSDEVEKYESDRQDELEKLTKDIESNKKQDPVDLNSLKEQASKISEAIKQAGDAVRNAERKQELVEKIEQKREETQSLSDEIQKLRAEKEKIIADADLPVKNITIDEEGMAMFKTSEGHLLPFSEEHVSYSEGGAAVIKLMAHINKQTPVWVIGKASEYDKNKIKMFANFAKQNNAIMLMDRVLSDDKKLEIEAYDHSTLDGDEDQSAPTEKTEQKKDDTKPKNNIPL